MRASVHMLALIHRAILWFAPLRCCTGVIRHAKARAATDITTALVLLLISLPASSMEFSLTTTNPFWRPSSDPNIHFFLMKGEILPGDYDRLLRYIAKENINLTFMSIVLESPGGDVSEALKLGRFIKSIYTDVAVGPTFGQCASACFIIFASALERKSDGGLVGIHRPYVHPTRLQALSPIETEKLENSALLNAEAYLQELRVPHALVEKMFEHASTEIYWLTEEDLENVLGRRAPWYEEFLIARCGLDKEAEKRFLTDPDRNAYLLDGLTKVFACGRALTEHDAIANYNKAMTPYGMTWAKVTNQTIPAAAARRESTGPKSGGDHVSVYSALDSGIPNWRIVNKQSEFLAWLNGFDPLTGETRQKILTAAFDTNDSRAVVSVFNAYLQERSTVH